MPTNPSMGKIPQSLEGSGRSQTRQRGDCSSDWKNTDSHALPSGGDYSSDWKNWDLDGAEPNLGEVCPDCSNKKGLLGV